MDGLVYLLDQAGVALAQANEAISRLSQRIEDLEHAVHRSDDPSDNGTP